MPEYYGILFFTLAGQGSLYTTQLSAGSLNVSAYALKTSSGGLNLVIVNKDTSNLGLTAQLPQSITSATLLELTQYYNGDEASPNLAALRGVIIQGSSVGMDGTFSPSSAYTLAASGSSITFYVPALSAVLVQIT
jgi:hypothetical protein